MLQHYDDGLAESEFSPAVLQLALSLAGNTRSAALYEAIMKVSCGSAGSPGSRQSMEATEAMAIGLGLRDEGSLTLKGAIAGRLTKDANVI